MVVGEAFVVVEPIMANCSAIRQSNRAQNEDCALLFEGRAAMGAARCGGGVFRPSLPAPDGGLPEPLALG